MSSEGSAEGLVPSALSSEKSPMLYVSFGENEQMCLLYDRTHTIHLAVSIANQMNKIKLERKKLEEELDEYRQRKSGTTNKKERSKLEDLMRITLLALTKQRPDLIMPDTNLLQMDICSQSKGILTWSRPLEEDVIEEAQNCETPLAVTERSKLCRHMYLNSFSVDEALLSELLYFKKVPEYTVLLRTTR